MSRPTPSLAVLRLIALGLLLAGTGIALMVLGTDGIGDVLERAAESTWGALAFVLLYIFAVITLVPGTIGTITSGAVFGFAVGFPVAMLGGTIGATIAFFVARGLGREGSQELLGSRLMSLDDWLGENDFVSIVILRLMPIVPFNLLNYAAGLTAMRPSRYIAGTVVGMVPGTALTTFAASRADDPSSTAFIAAAVALVLVVVISTYGARRYTKSRAVTTQDDLRPTDR